MTRSRTLSFLAVVALAGFAACGGDDPAVEEGGDDPASETTKPSEPAATTASTVPQASVRFTEPADGATVTSPVKVKFEATGVKIEAAGDGTVKAGSGHFHLMVDAGCVTAGEVITKDDTHQHFGMGQLEAELTLPAGSHKLCLQVGDAAHKAMPLTNEITVTVG